LWKGSPNKDSPNKRGCLYIFSTRIAHGYLWIIFHKMTLMVLVVKFQNLVVVAIKFQSWYSSCSWFPQNCCNMDAWVDWTALDTFTSSIIIFNNWIIIYFILILIYWFQLYTSAYSISFLWLFKKMVSKQVGGGVWWGEVQRVLWKYYGRYYEGRWRVIGVHPENKRFWMSQLEEAIFCENTMLPD